MHISRDGRVYQLDSFWKMYELYKELDKKYSKLIQITDEAGNKNKKKPKEKYQKGEKQKPK